MKKLIVALALSIVSPISAAHASVYPLQWENGTELLLFGTGDLAATNAYLRPFGLEAIPDHGTSTIAISPGEYRQSNFGPFTMAFAAVMARPIGSTVAESWYFFGMTTSNADLNRGFDQIWGIKSEAARTEVTLGWGVPWSKAETAVNGKVILRLFMADRNLPPQETAEYHFDVFSSAKNGLVQYHHDCSGEARNKDYDEKKGDGFSANPDFEIGRVLKAMKFTPKQWSLYHTDLGGLMGPSVD